MQARESHLPAQRRGRGRCSLPLLSWRRVRQRRALGTDPYYNPPNTLLDQR